MNDKKKISPEKYMDQKRNTLSILEQPTDIIIPTYNNVDQLQHCVYSMLRSWRYAPVRIIIVNNGPAPIEEMFRGVSEVTVIKAEKNLGWEGGLKEGLKHSTSKYVMFANDDIFVPHASQQWIKTMIRRMEHSSNIGAVGPSSNVVMGSQNIWSDPFQDYFEVPFLIGFCVLYRREYLDAVGGVDDSCPGGDDIDLSIRMRKSGYVNVCMKNVFVYHHGFQTGTKLHGDQNAPMGWNSKAMTDRTNDWIIKKHGFLAWWQTMVGSNIEPANLPENLTAPRDNELAVIKSMLKPGGKILDVGCGPNKTIPEAIGVDIAPKGSTATFIAGVADTDIVADLNYPLPKETHDADTIIARHIIEHLIDPVGFVQNMYEALKSGGQLIISTPDERKTDGIMVNPEHIHVFTPGSLKRLCELVGFKSVSLGDEYSHDTFTMSFVKP